MKTFFKLTIICLLIGSLLPFSGTNSYFHDTEYSSSNVVIAGLWASQSQMLYVDTSNTYVSQHQDECRLLCIRLQTMGDSDLVIDSVQVEWDENMYPITMLETVKIDEDTFFIGSVTSGTMLDDNDYVISPGVVEPYRMRVFFSSEVQAPFTIRFIMDDGSVREIFIPLETAEDQSE